MPDDAAPSLNTSTADPGPATPTPALTTHATLIERSLHTRRAVDRAVEAVLSEFLQWCIHSFNTALRHAIGEEYNDEALVEFLARISRRVRRIARAKGPEAAVGEMRNNSYAFLQYAYENTKRDVVGGVGMFEESEDEDRWEEMMEGRMGLGGGVGMGGMGGFRMGGGGGV